MADTVKFLAQEATLTTASNCNSASVVRLVNTDNTTVSTITQKNGGATVATFTLGTRDSGYGSVYIMKAPAHTLEASGGTVKAVSVGFY